MCEYDSMWLKGVSTRDSTGPFSDATRDIGIELVEDIEQGRVSVMWLAKTALSRLISGTLPIP
jgi:hypothetical protein